MTLNDTKNDLFTFFSEKDWFIMDENFDDLYILSENKEIDKALIEKALESFVESKIVSLITTDEGRKVWVLEKPIAQHAQGINLSYQTLAAITKIINTYCEQTKNDQDKVDPLNITEKDIQSLAVLAGQVIGMSA